MSKQDVLVELRRVLRIWREDAYPCKAKTCECESRWHMKTGPVEQLIIMTDKILLTADETDDKKEAIS